MEFRATIPNTKMGELRSRIDKLNRKAEKLGTSSFSLAPVGESIACYHLHNDYSGQPRYVKTDSEIKCDSGLCELAVSVPCITFIVSGETPVLAGWTFIASLQHGTDAETGEPLTIFRAFEEEPVPDRFRSAKSTDCEHCGIARTRIDTYVVWHVETGEFKHVGSTCLRDFLGSDPKATIKALELWETVKEYCDDASDEAMMREMSPYNPREIWGIVEVFAITLAVIRYDGNAFTTRRDADINATFATASKVQSVAQRFGNWYAEAIENGFEVTAEDYKVAQTVKEWAQNIEGNSYLDNVNALVRIGYVTDRDFGIAAAAVNSWRKEQTAKNETSSDAPSGKVTVSGIVQNIKINDWNQRKMLVKANEGFKVFVSVPTGVTVDVGQFVTFTATLEPSDRDATFAFGKRPKLAR